MTYDDMLAWHVKRKATYVQSSQLIACHDRQMQSEVPTRGKIEIALHKIRADEPHSQFLDELETDARRQGAEARREEPRRFRAGALYFVDLLTIGLVGSAATAVFARNVIGIAKDWIELTDKDNRRVKVTIGDKEVEIKQGDDIRELLQKYFADDGTSNPL
jgi:hypothetical protein